MCEMTVLDRPENVAMNSVSKFPKIVLAFAVDEMIGKAVVQYSCLYTRHTQD